MTTKISVLKMNADSLIANICENLDLDRDCFSHEYDDSILRVTMKLPGMPDSTKITITAYIVDEENENSPGGQMWTEYCTNYSNTNGDFICNSATKSAPKVYFELGSLYEAARRSNS